MQKRKFKLNILDVTIFVAILCAVAALVFRDNLLDVFGEPEIVPVSVTVTSQNTDETAKESLAVGSTVEIDLGNNVKVKAVVTSSEQNDNGYTVLGLTFNGYKKFGKFYSENGNQVDHGAEYVILANDKNLGCKVEKVEFSG